MHTGFGLLARMHWTGTPVDHDGMCCQTMIHEGILSRFLLTNLECLCVSCSPMSAGESSTFGSACWSCWCCTRVDGSCCQQEVPRVNLRPGCALSPKTSTRISAKYLPIIGCVLGNEQPAVSKPLGKGCPKWPYLQPWPV